MNGIEDIIHPRWAIEENAIRDGKWVCLSPPRAPITALNREVVRIMFGIDVEYRDKIEIGIIFCQVDRIIHEDQEILDITWGNQKWNGAAPILINRLIESIYRKGWWGMRLLKINKDDILRRRSLDPVAWARKYLIVASVSILVFDEDIMGIKDIIFNSKETQRKMKLDEEIAIIVLDIKIERNRKICGFWCCIR